VWVPDAVHEAVRDLVRARGPSAWCLPSAPPARQSAAPSSPSPATGGPGGCWSKPPWSYRHPGETLRARLQGLPKAVRDIAWKAQIRLCGTAIAD
jgi:hypothetical protein